MFYVFNIILAVLYRALELYELILLIRCIMSFFTAGSYNSFYSFLVKITEPVLCPIRNVINRTALGGIAVDFSPMFAIILIGVLERCLVLISRIF